MQHELAKNLFKEIQSRPFSISLSPDIPCNNCFYKNVELMQKLGIMGYAVRGRIGETYWDPKIIPKNIVDLLPEDILVTHFWIEIQEDGVWRPLDTTLQPELEEYGFTIGTWDNGKIAFPITKLYSQQESIEYQQQCSSIEYQRDFFERGGPCWKALNEWFEDISNQNDPG